MENPLAVVALLACASFASAQSQTVVVPNVNTLYEGNSGSRSPFSHPQARVQWLANGAELCKTSAVLLSFAARLDGYNFDRAGQPGTVQASVRCHHVPLQPSTLTNDWLTNLGTSQGDLVFSGTLNLPSVQQQRPLPHPWSLEIKLQKPFVYQRNLGSLLVDLQVTQGTSADWPADGIFVHGSNPQGQVIPIWRDQSCANARGDSASLSIGSSAGAVGQALQVDHTVSPAAGGKLDLVLQWLGLSNQSYGAVPLPLPLGALGMPNCALATDILLTSVTTGAAVVWPIPARPELVGTAIFFQGLAIDSTTLDFVVTQNAYQVLLGPAGAPSQGPLQMLHRGPYAGEPTGFLSPTGYYGMVLRWTGSFQ